MAEGHRQFALGTHLNEAEAVYFFGSIFAGGGAPFFLLLYRAFRLTRGAPQKRRRLRIGRLAFFAFLAAIGTSVTVFLSVLQIAVSGYPWDAQSISSAPTALTYQMYPFAGLLAFGATLLVLSLIWRSWLKPQDEQGGTRQAAAVITVLASIFFGSVSFGAANNVYQGSYPEPPQLYGYASGGVNDMAVDFEVGNTETSFLTGSISAHVTIRGAPNSEYEFMLLGNKYFAESEFVSDNPTVKRTDRGKFQTGSSSPVGCQPNDESTPTEWVGADVYRPIKGVGSTDSTGVAQTMIQYLDSGDWYDTFGERVAIHLPRYQVVLPERGECLTGFGGYSGTWERIPKVSSSMNLHSARLDPESLLVEVVPNDYLSSADKPTERQLKWFASRLDDEDGILLLTPGYVLKSPETVARAQTLLFTSALVFGLALAAVFYLVTTWPRPRSNTEMLLLLRPEVRLTSRSKVKATRVRPRRIGRRTRVLVGRPRPIDHKTGAPIGKLRPLRNALANWLRGE